MGTFTWRTMLKVGAASPVQSGTISVPSFFRLRCVGALAAPTPGTWITDQAALDEIIPPFYVVQTPNTTLTSHVYIGPSGGPSGLTGDTIQAVAYDSVTNSIAMKFRIAVCHFTSAATSAPWSGLNTSYGFPNWMWDVYSGADDNELLFNGGSGYYNEGSDAFRELVSRLGWTPQTDSFASQTWSSGFVTSIGGLLNGKKSAMFFYETAGQWPKLRIVGRTTEHTMSNGLVLMEFQMEPDIAPPSFDPAAFDDTNIVDKLESIRGLINPGSSVPSDLTVFEFPVTSEVNIPDYDPTLSSIRSSANEANPLSKLSTDWGSDYASTVTFSLAPILNGVGLTDTTLNNTITVNLSQFAIARTIIHAFIVICVTMWGCSTVFEEFRRY